MSVYTELWEEDIPCQCDILRSREASQFRVDTIRETSQVRVTLVEGKERPHARIDTPGVLVRYVRTV